MPFIRNLTIQNWENINGYFVKRLSPATDWIMRVTGDEVHRPYLAWRHGLMAAVPECIDSTVVTMEVDGHGATT